MERSQRQKEHDLIKRCKKKMEGYEEKLHLVEKFLSIREKIGQIDRLLESCDAVNTQQVLNGIREISAEIIEEL